MRGIRLIGLALMLETFGRVVRAAFHPVLYDVGNLNHELLSVVPVALAVGLPGVLLFLGAPQIDRWLRRKDARSSS